MVHVRLPVKPQAELEEEYAEHVDSFERALYEMHRRLRQFLKQRNIRATVKYRVKSFASYLGKIRSRCGNGGLTSGELFISDVLGMRIVCPFLDDLQGVEDMLAENFTVTEREKKGAEFSFKEFGYDSLHFLVELPGDVLESFHLGSNLVVEVQLRTILQDAWAEVEHEMVYKSQVTPFDANLRRKLAALNANLSLSDMIFHEIRLYQRELQRQLDQRRVAFMSMVQMEEVHSPETPQQAPQTDPAPAIGNLTVNTQESQLLKALYAHNSHDYELAREIYTEILVDNPPDNIRSMVLLHRGMARFATGDYDSSEQDFRSAIELNPGSDRAMLYLGLCLRQKGDDTGALELFNSCLDMYPDNSDVLLSRSQLYFALGNNTGAIRDCDQVLIRDPENAHAAKFREFINRSIGV